MFIVTEADAAAIRAALNQEGELSAAAEFRRRFPGFTDNAKAREWVRTIAGWKPLAVPPRRRAPARSGGKRAKSWRQDHSINQEVPMPTRILCRPGLPVVFTSTPAGFIGESWVAMPLPDGQHLNLQMVCRAPLLRTEAAVMDTMRTLADAYHFLPASIVWERSGE
jgi:hypothetical protein